MKEIKGEELRRLAPGLDALKAYIVTEEDLVKLRERSALSGLPGNTEIKHAIENDFLGGGKEALAVYLDINGFKAYNDNYGFIKGDTVIKTLAEEFSRLAPGFAGHIGGDDFAAVMKEGDFDGFIKELLYFFEGKLKEFYDGVDYERGCIITFDREGRRHRWPLMGITAVAFKNSGSFERAEEAGEFAAQLKKMAKLKAGKYVGNSLVLKYEGGSVTPLADLIKDEGINVRIRRGVIEALGEMKDFSYENILTGLLENESALFMKKSALYALGRLRMRDTVGAIEKFLRHRSAHLRMRAAEALGEIGQASSGDKLMPLLDDLNIYVRKAAALALGSIADKRFIGVLRKKMEDRSVRNEACISLAMLGDTEVIEGLPVFVCNESIDPVLRATAAEVLADTADLPAAKLLLKRLGAESTFMLVERLKAFSKVLKRTPAGERKGIDGKIFSLSGHSSWRARRALAEICGEISSLDSLGTLKKLCFDPSTNVRVRALESMAVHKGEWNFVYRFFDSSSPAVRSAAVNVIKRMRVPPEKRSALIEKLRLKLKDPSHDVASNAAKSIIFILRCIRNRP